VINLMRSEFLKVRSTQVWFWLLLASLAITAASVVGNIATDNNAQLAHDLHDILTAANSAYIASFVLGVLSVTTEFRYQTITPTVLATPSRWRLITAKLITFALVGAGFAVACVVIALAITVPWVEARGVHFSLANSYTPVLAAFTVVSLTTLIGLGAGALLKNQIVAVSVGLIVLLVVEQIVLAIPKVKYVYPYLPGGLARAVIIAADDDRVLNGVKMLPIWGGVVGLAVWGLGLALLGAGITMNRDIT
jgi:ABC-type transport system involved in multi-copper enzyme maturation permease subunit